MNRPFIEHLLFVIAVGIGHPDVSKSLDILLDQEVGLRLTESVMEQKVLQIAREITRRPKGVLAIGQNFDSRIEIIGRINCRHHTKK